MLLSHVRVHSDNGEKKEQLMLLFPGYLVMLSISPRISGYTYEVRKLVICKNNYVYFDECGNCFSMFSSEMCVIF